MTLWRCHTDEMRSILEDGSEKQPGTEDKTMEKYYEEACRLHRTYPVVDTHLDLAAEIYYRRRNGEREVIRSHYLEPLKKAGVRLVVSSVFLENEDLPARGLELTLGQIAALYEDLESVKEEVRLVRSKSEILQVIEEGKIGILLYMEGLDVLTWDCSMLRCFYEMGVRGASLTWSRRNYLGEGSCTAGEYRQVRGGLSELGKKTVRELELLHMFVDVSHLNDDGFADLAGVAAKPFIASHSNARTIHDNYRNLTDDQIRLLSGRGGVMGMNACSEIVGAVPGPAGISKMCDHIEHIIRLAGPEHVGIGLDLCDAYYAARAKKELPAQRDDCLKDHSDLILLTAELLRRGGREEDIARILGGNFLRYFCDVLE